MKKILFTIFTVLLLLTSLSGCTDTDRPPTQEPNPASDFAYTIDENGNVVITTYKGQSSTVVIPETIEGRAVVTIGASSFKSNVATSVYLPNTVTSIDNAAFYQCDKLEQIILSENITKIGSYAFEGCISLKHITIPATTKEIGDQAFMGAGLETVTFEEGIETIGGYNSFADTPIKELVLPSTVKEIGHSTFSACPNLETVVLNEGLVTIGHKAFVNNPKLKEIVIPKTVQVVTEMDFSMCSGLEKIKFDGDAPSTFEWTDEIIGVNKPYDVHFTVYYHEGAKGFTSPEWYGYATELW